MELQTLISALPRNTVLSFVVIGMPTAPEPNSRRRWSQSDVRLVAGVLPLFDHEGYRLRWVYYHQCLVWCFKARLWWRWVRSKIIDWCPLDPELSFMMQEIRCCWFGFRNSNTTSCFQRKFSHLNCNSLNFYVKTKFLFSVPIDYKILSEEDKLQIEWMIQNRYNQLWVYCILKP